MVKRASVLGLDVGGVIIDKANDNSDTSFFSKNYLATTAVPGAFEAIRTLTERFQGQVVIVSKASAETARRTREWLAYHGFWVKTGLCKPEGGQLFFCKERADKAPICKRRNVTHFIDDKREVLAHLRDIVPNRILFGPQDGLRVSRNERGLREIETWAGVLEKVWP